MFSGYDLTLDEYFFDKFNKDLEEYEEIGKNHLSEDISAYKKEIKKYIKNGTINGTKLQNDWFPEIDADVFISHSHKDLPLANALAGWINDKFGLKVFIDSNVWNYSDDLLEELNAKYSNKRLDGDDGYLYSHELCNEVSKHVNMMLSIALQKMIDKAECVILLNTENSIKVFDEENKRMNSTYSPWIYSEIVCTQIVRKKPLLLYRNYPLKIVEAASKDEIFDFTNLMISYNVSLEHLVKLSDDKLISWLEEYNRNKYDYEEYPLDALYKFTHENELTNTKNMFKERTFNEMNYIKNRLIGHGNEEILKFNVELCPKCKKCCNSNFIME